MSANALEKEKNKMCIIAIKPSGMPMFSAKRIRTMFANNPDGAGYMYRNDDGVAIRKGFLTADELIADLSINGQISDDKTIVFHFRIGTSGYNDRLNCHPFPIYDTNATTIWQTDAGIVHNGILRAYEPPKNSDINDTQIFIKYVLRCLKRGFWYDNDIMFLLEEIAGTNKFAILDRTGKLSLIGNFINDGGYIYSNTSYKTVRDWKK